MFAASNKEDNKKDGGSGSDTFKINRKTYTVSAPASDWSNGRVNVASQAHLCQQAQALTKSHLLQWPVMR